MHYCNTSTPYRCCVQTIYKRHTRAIQYESFVYCEKIYGVYGKGSATKTRVTSPQPNLPHMEFTIFYANICFFFFTNAPSLLYRVSVKYIHRNDSHVRRINDNTFFLGVTKKYVPGYG